MQKVCCGVFPFLPPAFSPFSAPSFLQRRSPAFSLASGSPAARLSVPSTPCRPPGFVSTTEFKCLISP